MTKEIFHPATGEALAVGQQTNTYSIMLSDEVLENVHMSRVCHVTLPRIECDTDPVILLVRR